MRLNVSQLDIVQLLSKKKLLKVQIASSLKMKLMMEIPLFMLIGLKNIQILESKKSLKPIQLTGGSGASHWELLNKIYHGNKTSLFDQ